MTPSSERAVRPTLHPLAIAALLVAGVLLVLLVVGVWIMIALLRDSRDHIRAQDAKTAVLLAKVRDATPTASRLVGETRPVIHTLGQALGPLSHSTSAVATATERLPPALNAVAALTANALPLLAKLEPIDLPRLLTSGGRLVDSALYRDRLTNALDGVNALLTDVRREELVSVSAHAARATPALILELLRVQRTTLEVQQRSLQTQLATLDVQRRALVHITSIDRKTGGPVPPAP